MTISSPITTLNESAEFWYYDIGVNPIPADTKNKITHENWSQWKDKSMPVVVFESYKRSGFYNNGIAIIPGKIWRGPSYEGKYLIAIDLDNKKAIEEFCRNNLERLKQTTLVEQTSNPDKMHIYFIVDKEIPNKSSDKTNAGFLKNINLNEIPAIEVKSNSKGIMFCANSPHQKDGNYQIIGTTKPQVFEAWGIQEQISIICDKYNIPYAFNNNSSSSIGNYNYNNFNIGPSIQELFSPGTKILEGHNRHLGILRVMDSLLIKNMGFLTLEEIKEHATKRNLELCVPPLDNTEIEKLWKQAYGYAIKKIREREEAAAVKKKQQQQKKGSAAIEYEDLDDRYDDETQSTTTATIKTEKQQLIEEGTQLVLSKYRFLTIEESKDILYYDDEKGVYVYGGEILIEKELEETFGFKLRTSDITEIKNHIMRQTYTKRESFDSNLDIVNFTNGLYNIRTDKFVSHTPEYYSLNQKPFPYNPKARPKYFIKFLKEVLWTEDITTAIDIIAYTFLRYNTHELYFILIGNGANGKSVYTGLVTNLHGLKNVSNVSLTSLVTNRFALADLENKDVNIVTELSSATIKDMSILKKLTGKQPIRIERKGKDAYEVILHAKQIFNANQMPNNPDNSDARHRREIPLSFPFQFEGAKDDPDLLKKLSTEEELSGIFNIIAHVLRNRIIKTQRVHINQKTIKERREKAEMTYDPIKSFKDKVIAKDSVDSDYEIKDDLYRAYRRFCKFYKLPVQQKETLGSILNKKPYGWKDGRKMTDGIRKTIWKGIRLKQRWKSDDIFLQQTLDGSGASFVKDDENDEDDKAELHDEF
jgi:putative DNA primase/helicase